MSIRTSQLRTPDAPVIVSPPRRRSLTTRCAEVFRLFGPFGFVAFGGPAANIVMLRKIFVVREKWVDEKTFTDLFALGNALPGPAFSQLAFAIALLRGGYLPALLSFVLLTGPGALAMFGLGFGVRQIPSTLPDVVFALFSGLNAAAVGLITLAAYNLSSKVITDRLTRIEVFLSAAFAICYESPWLYPVLMAVGGLTTFAWDFWRTRRAAILNRRNRAEEALPQHNSVDNENVTPSTEAIPMDTLPRPERAVVSTGSKDSSYNPTDAGPNQRDAEATLGLSYRTAKETDTHPLSLAAPETEDSQAEPGNEEPIYFSLSVRGGLFMCAAFLLFLVIVLVLRATTEHRRAFDFFVNLLVAGTIIFGGGPVVIPLLQGYTVNPGWVDPRDFLLGFAVIQAIPGPLFNFSVFLGVLALPNQPVAGGILGCVAIFLPGIVLKMGLLPLYTKWRTNAMTRSVLRGLNAMAVGLIFAATYRLLRVGFISPGPRGSNVPASYSSLSQDGWWVVITAATFVACEWFNLPTPAAIAGGAVGGIAWWGVQRN